MSILVRITQENEQSCRHRENGNFLELLEAVEKGDMEQYKNFSGNSGVLMFEKARDSITIKFRGDRTYLYNYVSPGKGHVDQMKSLADTGSGLGTYVNKYIKGNFARRLS